MYRNLPRITLLLLFLSQWGFAQHFGQNKLQTERSHWRMIQTEHFDIYFDQNGDTLAKWTAQNVEQAYIQVAEALGHKLYTRVPIILHNSPNHFRSTNVIPQQLPEAVGGFTEIFQNRIVLPFDGSYNEFRHVLQHEMVHAFMFDLFKGDGGSGGMMLAMKMDNIPLWFSEGLAEFASIGIDLESEPYLVDGISFGYLAPPSDQLGGFMAYRGGQNFLFFLEQTFGSGTVKKLIRALRQGMSMESAIGSVTKTTLEELGEIWLRELRRIYWPELGPRGYAKEFAHALTRPERDEAYTNLSPSLSPDGKWIAFGSDQGGFEGVYVSEIDSMGQLREMNKLVRNAWASDHESVHLFYSGYAWAPDSKRIAIASQSHGSDELQILDARSGKILQYFRLGLDMIRNPDWSSDGNFIVMSGIKNGYLDLYLLDLRTGQIQALTHSPAAEDHPKFSRDGKRILFESNQDFINTGIGAGSKDVKQIFVMDIDSRTSQALTAGPWNHEQASWGKGDSSFAYLSNQSGLTNLYLQSLVNDSSWQLTNVLSQINSYSWDLESKRLAFSLFEGGMFQLYLSDSVLGLKKPINPHISKIGMWFQNGMGESLYQKSALPQLEKWKNEDEVKDSCKLLQQRELRIQCSDKEWNHEFWKRDSLYRDSIEQSRRLEIDSSFAKRALNPALDSNGKLNAKAYQTQWSMDQMWLAAGGGYAGPNRYSVGGEAYMHFSDLMGDQGITAMLYGGGTDWREISALLSYAYLPYRNDYFGTVWYTPSRTSATVFIDTNNTMIRGDRYDESPIRKDVNFTVIYADQSRKDTSLPACIWYENGQAIDTTLQNSNGVCGRKQDYFDQNFGASVGLSHPFSRFSRFDLQGGINSVRRYKQELVCYDAYCQNYAYEDSKTNILDLPRTHLNLEFNFDNSRWGWTGPLAGSRAYAQARWVRNLDGKDHFGILNADARQYIYLGHAFAIALRASGGVSEALGNANNPYTFFAGGDDFFDLNYAQPRLSNTSGTLRESYSSELATPLRGFPYYNFRGSRFAIGNAELRYPLIQEIRLGFAPVSLGGIMGTFFYDVGGAWSRGDAIDQMGWSWGWGWRMNLGVFVLRYTKAYGHYFSYSDVTEHTHVSIGADF